MIFDRANIEKAKKQLKRADELDKEIAELIQWHKAFSEKVAQPEGIGSLRIEVTVKSPTGYEVISHIVEYITNKSHFGVIEFLLKEKLSEFQAELAEIKISV